MILSIIKFCMSKKYVLTGIASTGKTTLLNLFAERGFITIPEAADEIIKEESLKVNRGILGLGDVYFFQQKVAERQLELEKKAFGEIVFLDRSIIDGYAYCKRANVNVPEVIMQNSGSRYTKIFYLESLGVYEYDGVRTSNIIEAEKMKPYIEEAYNFFGYDLIYVPVMIPEDRVKYIMGKIE